MSNVAAINVNVDAETKKVATEILKSLGMNMSTAINTFLTQVVEQDGIPFEIKKRREPKMSPSMRRALKEVKEIESGKSKRKTYNTAEELFEAILNGKKS